MNSADRVITQSRDFTWKVAACNIDATRMLLNDANTRKYQGMTTVTMTPEQFDSHVCTVGSSCLCVHSTHAVEPIEPEVNDTSPQLHWYTRK